MEGEGAARSREVGVGSIVLTVHHASVPPMSVEKWRVGVKDKAEKLQPQPTCPEQTFDCHGPGGEVISAAQSWGRGEATGWCNSQHYGCFPPSFAAACGRATPRHDGRLGRGSFYQ